jgi:6,7-dimethyl-8-ribityllumazine synthase
MSQSAYPAAPGWRIAVAVARFNPSITERLLDGCRAALIDAGLQPDSIRVVPVPGAWELPLACLQLARSRQFDAVIALGAVVRGETAHFEFISAECARGLMEVSLQTDVPVAFGVLTPESGQQALERADPKRKNKGREAALAALDMIALKAEVGGER